MRKQEPQATDATEKGSLGNQRPLELELRRETQREPHGLCVIMMKAVDRKSLMHNPSLGKNAARKAFLAVMQGTTQAAEQALICANGNRRGLEEVEA